MADGDQVVDMTPEEITALREERDRLVAERDAANQRAESEARRADGLHGQVLDGSRKLNETGVQSLALQEQQAEATVGAVTGQLRELRSQYSALMAEGKFDEAAEVNEQIADAAARRNQAAQAKAYYGQQKTNAASQPVDPIERFFAANPAFNPPEQQWIRANPRYATDREFMERVNAAHNNALQKGVARFTPEYFQELERGGYQRPAPVQPQPQPQQQRQQRQAAGGEIPEDADPGEPYSDGAVEIVEDQPVQTPRPAPRQAAAPPSRRSPTTPPRQPQIAAQLTQEQADTALKNADLAPQDIQNQGDAAILNWWAELNNSPTAKRLRQEWAGA